jgi:hypothetical protein
MYLPRFEKVHLVADHASRDYSSHENTWDARNTKAYTAKESGHKYRAEYTGFSPVGMWSI